MPKLKYIVHLCGKFNKIPILKTNDYIMKNFTFIKRVYRLISYIIQICALPVVVSCTSPGMFVRSMGNIDFVKNDSIVTLESMFESFQLIPLENSRACMLNDVQKMQVMGDNIYILDQKPTHQLHIFGTDGRYKGLVGAQGHAKNEYTWLFDFCTKDDSAVCVLDFWNKIKIYDKNGKYIKTGELDTDNYFWTLDYYKGKYVITSLHNSTSKSFNKRDNLIYFFDENFKLIDEKIQLPEKLMNMSPFNRQPSLCFFDNKCLYYDLFQNKFFTFNMDDLSYQDEYDVKTPNSHTYDDFANVEQYNIFGKTMDRIMYTFCDGNKIYGMMGYEKGISYYELDMKDKKAKVYGNLCFANVNNLTSYNGYVYGIIKQESLIQIQKTHEMHLPTFCKSLENAINQHKDRLGESNNYFVVKMKPRKHTLFYNKEELYKSEGITIIQK